MQGLKSVKKERMFWLLGMMFLGLTGFQEVHASVIRGKGGIWVMHSWVDYALLRGKIKGLPASPATRDSLSTKGLYLTYVGLRGYSDALLPFRLGLEVAYGINLLNANRVMDVSGILADAFLQFHPVPLVGFELGLGHNWLGFPKNAQLQVNHWVALPKLVFDLDFSDYVGISLFGGLYLPLEERLWKAYVQHPSANASGLTGVFGTLSLGLSFVISERIFHL
jgi:hypothetical protein